MSREEIKTSKTVLSYTGFIIACWIVVAIFLTAKSYVQLGVGIVLYPLLIILAYKMFAGKLVKPIRAKSHEVRPEVETFEVKNESVVSDIEKRAFLKIVGATGISFFLLSVFGQRIQSLLFGHNISSLPQSTPFSGGGGVGASPTDEYTISEVDNENVVSYYGFINQTGGWFIMKEDANRGAFRYVKGSTDFPYNWKNRRNLEYNYFNEVFY